MLVMPALHQTNPVRAALPEPSRQALLEALDGARKAEARDRAVLATFGDVRPFTWIAEAEARHQDELLSLCRWHGVAVPPDPWKAHPPAAPDNLEAACAEGVRSEEATLAMYDRLLAAVKEPDLRAAFLRFQADSRDHHLPAFRACAGAAPRKP